MKKKNFLCIFPKGKNIHLIKDVGMIPYSLQENGYYNSTIAFYEDKKNLCFLDNEVKGLKYVKIKKFFKYDNLNIFIFLLLNFYKYDIVMFFHAEKGKFLNILFFKLLTLYKIKFYIKLDMNPNIMLKKYNKKSIKFLFSSFLASFADLITVETVKLNNFLNEQTFYKTKYLANGFLNENLEDIKKENTIITVGRLGSDEKDTDTFLRAIEKLDLKNWKIKLIGSVEKSFESRIIDFFDKNSQLRDNVIFTGNISTRNELFKEYQKAKVFVLTSKFESFGLVLVEALSEGCYIVATDLIPVHDITNNGKFGEIFPIGNDNKLSGILQSIIDEEKQLPDPNELKKYAQLNFNWKIIVERLYNYLEN